MKPSPEAVKAAANLMAIVKDHAGGDCGCGLCGDDNGEWIEKHFQFALESFAAERVEKARAEEQLRMLSEVSEVFTVHRDLSVKHAMAGEMIDHAHELGNMGIVMSIYGRLEALSSKPAELLVEKCSECGGDCGIICNGTGSPDDVGGGR